MKYFQRITFFLSLLIILTVILQSCKQEEKVAQNANDSTKPAIQQTPPVENGKDITLNDKAKKGQLLFYNANLGKIHVACATCHADGTPKTQPNEIRMGHTLAGVTSRTATWNGMFKGDQLKKYAYGAAFCATVFQFHQDQKNIDKTFSPDDIDALNEYLSAINSASGAMTSNLKIQWAGKPTFSDELVDPKIAEPAVKAIMKLPGDPNAGTTVFNQSCGTCHSINDKKIGPPMIKAAKDMNAVAQTIRFGSGAMAFYGKDVLSDQQAADAIAYIESQLGK